MKIINVIALLIMLTPIISHAHNTVAFVDAKLVKLTDEVSMVMCFGEDDETCEPWRHYYLYKAKVRQHLTGNITEKTVLFVNSQHTYFNKKYLKNWLVILHEIENEEQAKRYGANYIVVGSSFKHSGRYCFKDPIENYLNKDTPDNNMEESKFCYSKSELEDLL